MDGDGDGDEEEPIDPQTRQLVLLGIGVLKAVKSFWNAEPGSLEEARAEQTLIGGIYEIMHAMDNQ